MRSDKKPKQRSNSKGKLEVQSDNENEGAYDTRQSQATIGDHRMVEIDLQTKTLQIQQDQHKIKTLEQKCKVKDEQMQKLEESIIQLRTEIKEKEKMLEITNKEKDILQIQTKHVEQVDAQLISELNDLRQW